MTKITLREDFWKIANHEEAERIPVFWGGRNSSIASSNSGALCEELGITGYDPPVGDFGTVNLYPELKKRLHSDAEVLLLGSSRRRILQKG